MICLGHTTKNPHEEKHKTERKEDCGDEAMASAHETVEVPSCDPRHPGSDLSLIILLQCCEAEEVTNLM